MFIEEFQSDWAQKGKKDGFSTPRPSSFDTEIGKKAVSAIKQMDNLGFDSWQQAANAIISDTNYESNFDIDAEHRDVLSKWREQSIAETKRINTVPNMPFKKTDQWVNLAVRRMMRYAAENINPFRFLPMNCSPNPDKRHLHVRHQYQKLLSGGVAVTRRWRLDLNSICLMALTFSSFLYQTAVFWRSVSLNSSILSHHLCIIKTDDNLTLVGN